VKVLGDDEVDSMFVQRDPSLMGVLVGFLQNQDNRHVATDYMQVRFAGWTLAPYFRFKYHRA
jgi:hypothetical protein